MKKYIISRLEVELGDVCVGEFCDSIYNKLSKINTNSKNIHQIANDKMCFKNRISDEQISSLTFSEYRKQHEKEYFAVVNLIHNAIERYDISF